MPSLIIFRSHSSSIVTSACDVLPPKSFNTRATKGPHVVMIWKHSLEHNDLGPFIFETFLHHPWLIARPFYHQPCDLKLLIFSQAALCHHVTHCHTFHHASSCTLAFHDAHSQISGPQSNFTHLMSCGVQSYCTWVCHFEDVTWPHVSLTHRQTKCMCSTWILCI